MKRAPRRRFGRLLQPFAFVLFLGAATGCSADAEDPPAEVSEERITRIKNAFTSATQADFKPIENVVDQATIAGWNVDARDVQSYVFVVDAFNVYVVSFEADTRAVLEGTPPSPTNPHESFLLFLDPTADASTLTSVALYREDTKQWVDAAPKVLETHPPPPAVDGGVPVADAGPIDSVDAGPIVDAGYDATVDGGPVDASVDGSVDASPDGPTDASTDAKPDGPTDASTDAKPDGPVDAGADG